MTAMRERAAVGTHWRRRRDKTLWVVKQTHRVDRLAELHPVGECPGYARRVFVSFTDLRTKFEEA